MAVDKKISQLTSLAQVDVSASTDVLPIVDTSATETKKITVSALVGAGATAGISGAVLTNGTINSTTIGATTPSTGAFTTLSASGNFTLSGGTANGVLYLNGSKVATSGSGFTFSSSASQVGAEIYQNANLQSFLRIANDSTGAAGDARLYFQNSINTIEFGLPSTGFTTSGLKVANTAYLYFDGANGFNIGATNGSGLLKFYTGGTTERMRLDSSGNLGLGVTPSAWSTAGKNMQFGNGPASIGTQNSGDANFMHNAYESPAGTFKYASSGIGSLRYQLDINNNAHKWYYAASGTAGNAITFTQAMTLDSSGNVGIGTASPGEILHLNASSAPAIRIQSTAGNMYIVNRASSTTMEIFNAANGPLWLGTNNAERMRIDSSGNVGIGTATNNVFDGVAAARPLLVQSSSSTTSVGSSTNAITICNSDTTTNNVSQLNFAAITGASANQYSSAWIAAIHGARVNGQYPTGQLVFATSSATNSAPSEKMRIDSSGNVGIGGTAQALTRVDVVGTLPTSSNQSEGIRVIATIPSGSTTGATMFGTWAVTQAASFTLSSLIHFKANQQTLGAGSAITNQYGFYADAAMTGATNNYGFYSNIASGSNRWNFYAAGTAQNYFAGNTAIGGGVDANHRLTVENTGAVHGQLVIVDNTSYYDVQMWNKATSGNNKFCAFLTDGGATNRGDITYNRGAGQVAYNVTSDVRLKENIADAVDAGDKIDAMQVRQFDWKETGNHLDYGFVAQELHNVAPHAVSKPTNDDEMWSVDYSKLVPILVKELQAVRARLAALEAK